MSVSAHAKVVDHYPDRAAARVALGIILVAATCALGLGISARVRSMGAAPLAVDEYFIVRSTQNLLRHGWPVFDCGGLYGRGLLLQYSAALLNLLGVSAETAPRWVSAVCSLLALPAVYVIGRRVHSPAVGLLAVAALAVSVWEVEMARFGRMYAPFQAVFVWYVVCFLRRSVDNDRRAALWMSVLTVIGALLWEGGVLMGLANFLPILLRRRSLRLSRAEWREVAGYAVVLATVYWFDTSEFRFLETVPALPLDYKAGTADVLLDPWRTVPTLWTLLRAHPSWLALVSVPLLATALALRALRARRTLDWAAFGLLVALAGAFAHQFVISVAAVLLLALMRLSPWQYLTSRAARTVYGAVGIWALFWAALAYSTWRPPPSTGLAQLPLSFLYPLVSFPDVVNQLLRPWGSAIPLLGTGLVLLVSLSFVQTLRSDEPGLSATRALLGLVLTLLFVTCASDVPRHETRYVFFLYPTVLVLAFGALATLTHRLVRAAPAQVLVACGCLGLFMLSEDFQPRHLLTVAQPSVLYRRGLSSAQQSHLVVRDDTRAIADWLRHHAGIDDAVIVSAVQGLDYYAPEIQYFYVDREDFNFESHACRYGTVDRWSSRPLLQSVTELQEAAASKPRAYLVVYAVRLAALLPLLSRFHPRVALAEDHIAVVALVSPATSAGAVE